MPDDSPVSRGKRSYHSTVRADRALTTRRRVIEAATTHFLDAGYAGTSLAAVAGSAGVSVDTVYKTFGSKIGLLKAVLDVTLGVPADHVRVLDFDLPADANPNGPNPFHPATVRDPRYAPDWRAMFGDAR